MAVKVTVLVLFLYLLIIAGLLRDPFPIGYSMGNLGTILWYKGYSAKQSWLPAAFCDSSIKRGFDLAIVSYYDEMDNLKDRNLYRINSGVLLTTRYMYFKTNFDYFDAFNTYFEQSFTLSVALSIIPSLNVSLEGNAYRVGLSGTEGETHTIGELGMSAWVGMQFVGFSLQCKHFILKKSHVDGMDPPQALIFGIHTPSSRFGAQGVVFEVNLKESKPLRWKIGEEVRVLKWLAIQAGVASNPVQVGMGLSINLQHPSVTAALVNQPLLGWSRGFYLGYSP